VVDTFTTHAIAAGDAIVFEVSCSTTLAAPTALSVSAPGWTFAQIGALSGSVAAQRYIASFGAIAPDTANVSITVTWTTASCDIGRTEIGDEFANADPTGGTVTFDGHTEATGTGNCQATVTTGHDRDAVWGACISAGAVSGVGPGFTKTGDDGTGNWSEYRLTTDPGGTAEAVTFTNTTAYALAAMTIKPR